MVSKYRDLLDPVDILTLAQRETASPSQSQSTKKAVTATAGTTPYVSPAAWRLGSSASSNALPEANIKGLWPLFNLLWLVLVYTMTKYFVLDKFNKFSSRVRCYICLPGIVLLARPMCDLLDRISENFS